MRVFKRALIFLAATVASAFVVSEHMNRQLGIVKTSRGVHTCQLTPYDANQRLTNVELQVVLEADTEGKPMDQFLIHQIGQHLLPCQDHHLSDIHWQRPPQSKSSSKSQSLFWIQKIQELGITALTVPKVTPSKWSSLLFRVDGHQ